MFSAADLEIGLEDDRPGRPDLARRTRMLYVLVLVLGLAAVVWLGRLTEPHQELGFFYLAILVLACLDLGLAGLAFVPLVFLSSLVVDLGGVGADGPAGLPENWLVRAASFTVVGGVAVVAHRARARLEAHRRALEVALSRYEAVVACLPDSVLILDPGLRIRGVGGRFRSYLGSGDPPGLGRHLSEVLGQPSAASGVGELVSLLDSRRLQASPPPWDPPTGSDPSPSEGPTPVRIDLDPLCLEAVPAPIRAAGGDLRGWVVVLRDVTERLQAEHLLVSRARALAVQETRRQLAQHLHDHVAQSLAALRIRLDLLSLPNEGGADRVALVRDLQEALSQAVRELRQTMWELRPTVLERLPFVEALRAYLADLQVRSGFQARLLVQGPVRLATEREVLLFRVVQEAVTNALKHSGASEVVVSLSARDGLLEVEVRDDGVGFDPSAVQSDALRRSYGLRDMQDRARVLGTTLEILASPGQGTRLRLSITQDPEGGDLS